MLSLGEWLSRARMILALLLIGSPIATSAASAQQLEGLKPTATSEPVAVYITLCLWSQERPVATCRDVPLTPGAGGPGFANMQACQDGQEEAVRAWRAQAGPVFGFTEMAGEGYRIERIRCTLPSAN